MARIILLRHAAADAEPAGRDASRPLSRSGRQEAQEIGAWLLGIGWVPDAAITSPALRARQTAEAVLDATGAGLEPRIDEALYSGGPGDHLAAARTAGACTLVVGHNPSIEKAVSQLAGRPTRMGTACAACFEDNALVHLQHALEVPAGQASNQGGRSPHAEDPPR